MIVIKTKLRGFMLYRAWFLLFLLIHFFPSGLVNENAQIQYTKLPASLDVYIQKNVTLRFETSKDVIESLKGPFVIDKEVKNLICQKFELVLGEPLYPIQIAHLLF
jgi:hypothetical protein